MNDHSRLIQDQTGARAPMLFAMLSLFGFGLLYCVLTSSLLSVMFPKAAMGSLLEQNGRSIGSAWVAQAFTDDRYFHGRPSAAGFDPMAAAGSNLARSHPALRARMAVLRAEIAAREHIAAADVPAELLTTSGSGFDPHLSPAAAAIQIARVARARSLPESVVAEHVSRWTERPQWGVLGSARVNVLQLNLALDQAQHPRPVQDLQ